VHRPHNKLLTIGQTGLDPIAKNKDGKREEGFKAGLNSLILKGRQGSLGGKGETNMKKKIQSMVLRKDGCVDKKDCCIVEAEGGKVIQAIDGGGEGTHCKNREREG